MKFQISAVAIAGATLLLSACGGGGGGDANGGGAVQSISFPFAGGATVALPPEIATTKLNATASSGGPITYTANTPSVCTVNGATLSLLKAGECAVTAAQTGFNGYAPVSERQLFVVPKRPQMVIFRNPGAQALDAQPVALTAMASTGQPVTFASSTPSVCTVSGTTLTKLANGLCTVTGTQAGDDIFAAASVVKNVPIGTEKSPVLTYASGFKDGSTTLEGGTVNGYAGSSANGWWCNNWCDQSASSDGGSLKFAFNIKLDQPDSGLGAYYGLHVLAGGLKELSKVGTTPTGLRIDSQATVKFKLAQNVEWINSGNHTVTVELVLGHFALKDGKDACNVKLGGKVTPTAASAEYSVALKDVTVTESCGLTGLNTWFELQDYAIAQISFGADSANISVSSTGADQPTYTTQLTLTGPITFQ